MIFENVCMPRGSFIVSPAFSECHGQYSGYGSGLEICWLGFNCLTVADSGRAKVLPVVLSNALVAVEFRFDLHPQRLDCSACLRKQLASSGKKEFSQPLCMLLSVKIIEKCMLQY